MVFAIAALLLQVTPAVAAPAPAATVTVSSVTSNATPAMNTIAELKPFANSGGAAILATPSPDNAATVRVNVEPTTLENTDSKQKPAYNLSNVAMEEPQNSKSFETIRIPEANPGKPVGIKSAESYPSRKTWLALAIAEHSAAFFDAYSTRQAVSRGAVEADPMMRPFAHSPAIYGAIQVGPVLLDLVSRKMQHSEYGFVRHMWWAPQTLATGTYLFSGVHNLGVMRQPN
jgi:hypothetical protein